MNDFGTLRQGPSELAGEEPSTDGHSRRARVRTARSNRTHSCARTTSARSWWTSQFVGAEPPDRWAVEVCERALGRKLPNMLVPMNDLGTLLRDQGKLVGAEPLDRGAQEAYRRTFSDGGSDMLISASVVGMLLKAQGKLGTAEPLCRRAFQGGERAQARSSVLPGSCGDGGPPPVNTGARSCRARAISRARSCSPTGARGVRACGRRRAPEHARVRVRLRRAPEGPACWSARSRPSGGELRRASTRAAGSP